MKFADLNVEKPPKSSNEASGPSTRNLFKITNIFDKRKLPEKPLY